MIYSIYEFMMKYWDGYLTIGCMLAFLYHVIMSIGIREINNDKVGGETARFNKYHYFVNIPFIIFFYPVYILVRLFLWRF